MYKGIESEEDLKRYIFKVDKINSMYVSVVAHNEEEALELLRDEQIEEEEMNSYRYDHDTTKLVEVEKVD